MEPVTRSSEETSTLDVMGSAGAEFQALLIAAGIIYAEHARMSPPEFLSRLSDACASAAEDYGMGEQAQSGGVVGHAILKSIALSATEDGGDAKNPAEIPRALMAMTLSGLCQELAMAVPDPREGETPSPLAIATHLTSMMLNPPDIPRHEESILRSSLLATLDQLVELSEAGEREIAPSDEITGVADPSRLPFDVRLKVLVSDPESALVMVHTEGMKDLGFQELIFFGELAGEQSSSMQRTQLTTITNVLAKSALELFEYAFGELSGFTEYVNGDWDTLPEKALISPWGVHHGHLVKLDEFMATSPELYRDLCKDRELMEEILDVADDEGEAIVLTVCNGGTACLMFMQPVDADTEHQSAENAHSKAHLH